MYEPLLLKILMLILPATIWDISANANQVDDELFALF